MTQIPRPQPLGAFALPAGLMLIPGETHQHIRDSLLQGRLPDSWPAELEGQRLAYAGEADAAADWFAAEGSATSQFNLFVIDPDRIERAAVVAVLGEDWKPLVDYVAFTNALTSIPPSPSGTDGELAALLWTAQAAAAIENGDEDELIESLAQAANAAIGLHPAFAGVTLTELSGRTNDLEAAEEAVELLRGTDLPVHYAEAIYQRAGLIHGLALEGRRPLAEAINGYNEALRFLTEGEQPALFARVHMNLGTALLAQPVTGPSDHLRAGVAVQSLRTATRLLDPETDAEEWASAHLNLANALVYAPSTHQRDNLMEAVDLYEKVVKLRTAKADPLGRARVLSNQGNALAHLGLHEDARQRFDEATYLFASNGDEHSAQIVRDLTAELELVASQDPNEGATV